MKSSTKLLLLLVGALCSICYGNDVRSTNVEELRRSLSSDDDDDDDDHEGDADNDANEEDEDDEMNGSARGRRRATRKAIDYSEDQVEDRDDDDYDDDDDNIPLAALKTKNTKKSSSSSSRKSSSASRKSKNGVKRKATTTTSPRKKTAATKKAANSPRKGSGSTNENGSSATKYEFASAALYGTQCAKGLLIQRLLCRWWYAMEWPVRSELPDKPPPHFDSLDGFPGVYVGTEGAVVGQLRDVRSTENRPSFRNFARKPSSELQQLLLTALEEQKKQLRAHEGPSASTSELDELIKWTKKVNPKKADQEAANVLKTYRLKLP